MKWDGKDNAGKLVKAGKYTVLIEAVREHGTDRILRQEMDFNGAPKQVRLPQQLCVETACGTEVPRVERRTAIVSRWLHIYLSMVSFGIVLFFASTG